MQVDSRDIWTSVIKQTRSLSDLAALKASNKLSSSLVHARPVEWIKERFHALSIDWLWNWLLLQPIAVSGSFILQCLLDEHWSSDIDLFFMYDASIEGHNQTSNPIPPGNATLIMKYELVDLLLKHGFTTDTRLVDGAGNTYALNKFYSSKYTRDDGTSKLSSLSCLLANKLTIDIIQLKSHDLLDSTLISEISNSFDFDFCKNILLRGKLTMLHPESVITRSCVYSPTRMLNIYVRGGQPNQLNQLLIMYYSCKLGPRYTKYTNRKFTIRVTAVEKQALSAAMQTLPPICPNDLMYLFIYGMFQGLNYGVILQQINAYIAGLEVV